MILCIKCSVYVIAYIKSQATRGLPSMFVSQIVIIMEMRDAVERSRVGEAAGRV